MTGRLPPQDPARLSGEQQALYSAITRGREWRAHSAVAGATGIPEHVLAELRAGGQPRELTAEESAALTLARAAIRGRRLTDPEFAGIERVLGTTGIVEVVAIAGYYTLLAGLMSVFDIGLSRD